MTFELEAALQKYQHRGWTLMQAASTADAFGMSALFPFGPRSLGDSKTFKIKLNPQIAPDDLWMEKNSWTVSYDTNMTPHISAVLVRSSHLAFSYLARAEESPDTLRRKWRKISDAKGASR